MKKTLTLAAFAAILSTSAALANDYTLGALTIEQPVARATLPNQPVSAGYMVIRNTGTETDRLVAASVAFAGKVEIHEMTMDGDVMKMREIEGGVEIPAGGMVMLKPGGFHVMFMQMKQGLAIGETYPATLTFENAGTIEIELAVEDLPTIRKRLGGGMMNGQMGKGHGNGHGDGHGMKQN